MYLASLIFYAEQQREGNIHVYILMYVYVFTIQFRHQTLTCAHLKSGSGNFRVVALSQHAPKMGKPIRLQIYKF